MSTRSDHDLQLGKLIAGIAAGALAMFLFDPARGASRRAAAAGSLRQAGQDAANVLTGAVQDMRHRAGAADVFHTTDSDAFPARSPASLARQAVEALGKQLNGSESIAQAWRDRAWDPGSRTTALWGGGALGLFGLLRRRSPLALAAGLAGAALLARGVGRQPLSSLLSSSADPTIDIERSIRIDAAPEQVYDLWANYDNFPRFMSNVLDVRDLGANLSRWTVKGPAGVPIEWHSLLTVQERPRRLAWHSIPGGDVDQRGEVRVEPYQGGTRVIVSLRYAPPAGRTGQALASLLGNNPKAQLDEDLQRMKRLLEKGALMHAVSATEAPGAKFLH